VKGEEVAATEIFGALVDYVPTQAPCRRSARARSHHLRRRASGCRDSISLFSLVYRDYTERTHVHSQFLQTYASRCKGRRQRPQTCDEDGLGRIMMVGESGLHDSGLCETAGGRFDRYAVLMMQTYVYRWERVLLKRASISEEREVTRKRTPAGASARMSKRDESPS
jgi:hypothetical protein